MKKEYIAPQIEVDMIGVQTIICASAGPAPAGGLGINTGKSTDQVW